MRAMHPHLKNSSPTVDTGWVKLSLRGLIALACSLLVGACGNDPALPSEPTATGSVTTFESTTTFIVATSTTTTIPLEAQCDSAVQEANAILDTFLDRMDSDPEGVIEASESGAVEELFTEVGSLLASECAELSGQGLSGFIVHLAEEGPTRPLLTQEVIEAALEGLCMADTGFELNLQARAACTSFGS